MIRRKSQKSIAFLVDVSSTFDNQDARLHDRTSISARGAPQKACYRSGCGELGKLVVISQILQDALRQQAIEIFDRAHQAGV
jgi:hypothetical protein